MQRTPTTTDCVRFLQNPNINPKTGYYIHPQSPDYQRYVAQCGQPNRPMSPGTRRTLTEELMFLTPSFKNTGFPGQQATIPTQQQQRQIIATTLPPNVPLPGQQTTVPFQQQRPNVPIPGQQTTVPFQQRPNVPIPGQQPTVPFQQRPNVPIPGQQTNIPFQQQRPNIPFPGQQTNVPFPGQQTNVPFPGQQTNVPFPGQQTTFPFQQQRPASPIQRQQSPIQRPASPIQRPASPMQQRQQSPMQRPASPMQRPASPMQQRQQPQQLPGIQQLPASPMQQRQQSPVQRVPLQGAPIQQARAMPQQGNYYQQDAPTAAEFKFNVPEEHQALVQASIEVARMRYPSFDLYIQAAEVANILPDLRAREQYPSYFRDASPFEIFKIYDGPAADRAREFLRTFIEDHVDERGDAVNKDAIDYFMNQQGYRSYYMGYLRTEDPSVQAYFGELDLTPENFTATITPDKAILMEMYRKKALQGGIANMTMFANKDEALFHVPNKGRFQYDNGPILQSIGFQRTPLRRRIIEVERELPEVQTTARNQRGNNITRDYIRYQGETAVNANGKDITNKGLSTSAENRVPYYAMVYDQLRERGLVHRLACRKYHIKPYLI